MTTRPLFSGSSPDRQDLQDLSPGPPAPADLVEALKKLRLTEPPADIVTAVSVVPVLELDGGGAVIVADAYGWVAWLTFPLRIFSVTLQNVRAQSGSATLDIQTCTPGTSPVWTSICAAAIPAISSSDYYHDDALTGWTTTLSRGTGLRAVLSGPLVFTQLSVALGAKRLDVAGP